MALIEKKQNLKWSNNFCAITMSRTFISQPTILLILTLQGFVVAHSTSELNQRRNFHLRLSLRGGATILQQPKLKTSSSMVQLHPDEQKPEISRVQSVLALNEVQLTFGRFFPLKNLSDFRDCRLCKVRDQPLFIKSMGKRYYCSQEFLYCHVCLTGLLIEGFRKRIQRKNSGCPATCS